MDEEYTGGRKALWAAVIVAVAASGLAVYFYVQAARAKNDPNAAAQAEVKQLVAEVGRLILLPQGETPTVATVVNPDELKSQAFFANAKKGDKLLLYTTARKAILYDPSQNIIVEVAPINIGQTPPAVSKTSTSTER